MATITISFCLDPEADKRLVRWLTGLPIGKRSGAIRNALAEHLGRNVTNRDILEAIRELQRNGVVAVQESDPDSRQGELPQEILDNLAGLGL